MSKTTRREFIKTTSTAVAGVAAASIPAYSYNRILGSKGKGRTAIIGAGDRMKGSLVPAFFSHSEELNFELVAVSDIWKIHRENNTAKIQNNAKYKTKVSSIAMARNNDELYAMKDIDAVMIATADFQ